MIKHFCNICGKELLQGQPRVKYKVRKLAGSKEKWYGLDNSSLIVETVPLIVGSGSHRNRICRLNEEEKQEASPRS